MVMVIAHENNEKYKITAAPSSLSPALLQTLLLDPLEGLCLVHAQAPGEGHQRWHGAESEREAPREGVTHADRETHDHHRDGQQRANPLHREHGGHQRPSPRSRGGLAGDGGGQRVLPAHAGAEEEAPARDLRVHGENRAVVVVLQCCDVVVLWCCDVVVVLWCGGVEYSLVTSVSVSVRVS
jgi:hypothetical protein